MDEGTLVEEDITLFAKRKTSATVNHNAQKLEREQQTGKLDHKWEIRKHDHKQELEQPERKSEELKIEEGAEKLDYEEEIEELDQKQEIEKETDMRAPDSFSSDLGLSEWVINTCTELGMKKPTPVQYHCIPKILAGNNVLGLAETGSGKTAAFALPILQKLAEEPYGVFALVVTPTRELAEQFRALEF